MRRGMRVSVRVAPMLLFLGACGADGHTLTEIRERGVFSICADPDALPYSTRAGAPDGLEIDLARILVDRLGVRLDIDWVALRGAARRVNCDAIMGSAELTDDESDDTRKSPPGKVLRIALTRPYARQATRVVTGDGGVPVRSLEDLRGRSVAVMHGSLVHYLFNKRNVPVRTLYPTEGDILTAIANKEMSAGVVGDWYAGWYLRTHPEVGLKIEESFVLDPELDYNVAITLRNTDTGLLTRIDAILADLKADGSIQRLFDSYGVTYRPPTDR